MRLNDQRIFSTRSAYPAEFETPYVDIDSVVDLCLFTDWWSLSSDDDSPLPPPVGQSELRRGDRALWTCPAVAALAGRRQPRPGARWTRDGAVVAAAGRATVHEDGALEIEDVQSSDAGEYRCGVEVRGGHSENESQWSDALTLTILEHPDSKKFYSNQQERIFFTMYCYFSYYYFVLL